MPRTYRLSKRAERQQETRRRIEAATIALHEEIGGGTTITAIAERAGVSRLTVYRHFPDERSLLAACTGTYLAANPPPDPQAWATISDPEVRLRLPAGRVVPVLPTERGAPGTRGPGDADDPTLTDVLAPYRAAVAAMADVLVPGWTHEQASEPPVRAAAGLAVAFSTWETLAVEQGLTDFEAAALMFDLVRGAGQPQRSYRIARVIAQPRSAARLPSWCRLFDRSRRGRRRRRWLRRRRWRRRWRWRWRRSRGRCGCRRRRGLRGFRRTSVLLRAGPSQGNALTSRQRYHEMTPVRVS